MNNGIFNVRQIANYILHIYNEEGETISNLKLQKVLYYIQGYSLKSENEPAFDEEILHWAYGPVVARSYYDYCMYGSSNINMYFDNIKDDVYYIEGYKDKSDLYKKVIKKSIEYTTMELVRKTHGEEPWCETSKNDVIDKQSIKLYFKKNDPLEIYK